MVTCGELNVVTSLCASVSMLFYNAAFLNKLGKLEFFSGNSLLGSDAVLL